MIHLAVLIVSAWIILCAILCAVAALLWLAGGTLKVLRDSRPRRHGPPPPDPWGEKAKADAAWAATQDKGARKLPTADERWKALQR